MLSFYEMYHLLESKYDKSQIIDLYNTGEWLAADLAEKFGTNRQQINLIIRQANAQGLIRPEAIEAVKRKSEEKRTTALSAAKKGVRPAIATPLDVENQITDLLNTGEWSIMDLASKFNIHRDTISRIMLKGIQDGRISSEAQNKVATLGQQIKRNKMSTAAKNRWMDDNFKQKMLPVLKLQGDKHAERMESDPEYRSIVINNLKLQGDKHAERMESDPEYRSKALKNLGIE